MIEIQIYSEACGMWFTYEQYPLDSDGERKAYARASRLRRADLNVAVIVQVEH